MAEQQRIMQYTISIKINNAQIEWIIRFFIIILDVFKSARFYRDSHLADCLNCAKRKQILPSAPVFVLIWVFLKEEICLAFPSFAYLLNKIY